MDKEKVSAEHEEVKKEISALKLRKLRRELHESADVESYLMNMLLAFRSRLEGMPQKMAMQLIDVKDINEIIGILRKGVSEALNELAGYDPDAIDGQQQGTYEEDMEDLENEEEE